MFNLTDYGYSGMDNDTKVHHFFQGIKSTDVEAAVNVVQAQQEKYGTDFERKGPHVICPDCKDQKSANKA